MNKQRAAKLYELANRLSKLDVKSLSEQQRKQRNTMIAKLQEEVKTIKEFSPSSDDNNDENEDLYNYAKMWYNGDMSTQEDVEKALDLIGWEIGEIESEEGGAFIIKSGDENGDTYMSFTPEDLSEGVAEDMSRRGFLRGLGAAALGAAGVSATDNAQARATPEWQAKVEQAKQLLSKGLTPEQVAKKLGVAGPNNGSAGPMGGDWGAINYAVREIEQARRTGMKEDFNGEYDDEAGMAKGSLHTMERAVNGLLDTIQDSDNLPEWCQEKLSLAEDYLTTVWDYLLSQKEQGMDPKLEEAAPQVDSLVTDTEAIMDKFKIDAEQALKTVLGNREYNSRRGYYNFYLRQIISRSNQKGVTETKKPSPKLTPVNIKKSEAVSEEINKEAYERLQKVFDFSNYKG